MPDQTGHRKDDHLRITFEEDVSFDVLTTGFECYRFVHQALPEIDMDQVNTRTKFLGRQLTLPLLISSATGGTPRAGQINQMLAEAAQEAGIGMGLGSMRAALENSDMHWTFQVRRYAPDVLLLANLGAVQLNYGYGPDDCQRLIDMVEADGLYLHLNPLQEALQPEGNTQFSGLLRRIEAVCKALKAPVIVKEVGWGLSRQAARQLAEAGVAALDVAGAGGTSWSQVEMHRSQNVVQREVAAAFRDWGISTATTLRMTREVAPDIPPSSPAAGCAPASRWPRPWPWAQTWRPSPDRSSKLPMSLHRRCTTTSRSSGANSGSRCLPSPPGTSPPSNKRR